MASDNQVFDQPIPLAYHVLSSRSEVNAYNTDQRYMYVETFCLGHFLNGSIREVPLHATS